MVYILIFIFGTVFGSFLNVVIDRFATNRSIFKGRSYCEKCKKILTPFELIPIVSFILLRGKCKNCKGRIPIRLPIVEILGGFTCVFLYHYMLSSSLGILQTLILGIIIFILIAIFFIDLEYGIIPDKLIIMLTLFIFLYLYLIGSAYFQNIIAGILALLFFLFLFIATGGKGMGFGDVKLSFGLGLLLGFPGIVIALYMAFLTGAAISIILVLWQKKSFKKSTIPFGPFLVFGTIIAFFYGNMLFHYFLNFF